ncbi:MAG TPA: hypothetical protein ENK25_06005 [Bacteroidetes bacterium]|nr:hypothetical protein [Bacteroidota bacterium]
MKKRIYYFLIAGLVVLATAGCRNPLDRKQKNMVKKVYINKDKLEKIWVTNPALLIPESVLYDSQRNVIYVSNINGKPSEKDGNGFISLISPDGRVVERKWVIGLDAPKGLGIRGDKLYVSDIQSLVEISIPERKILNRYKDSLAVFLNDVAVDADGNVYVSDMGGSAVYRLRNGVFLKWIHDKRLNGPNGLYVEDNKLLAGLKDRIVSIDIQSGKISDYILQTGSIDGLEGDGCGNYLISDWTGHVYLVSRGKKKIILLNTTPIKMQAADINFVKSSAMLLVPTFGNNRVVAYRYK